ncbi:S8 family peptidase [Colwellia psychrerythraea]|uniref:Alkaline serine protease, subtilase family n=1 Tax=Colwellia psychrerythraea (strain 34H / ATCC BAA-681) TaxID=167879 RepID=Q488L1_COLP3|nr:S8 family peptidase [Colwellia psychrerythraea]AAZ25570.1 alkaline serine protease, subtilase family [Colwellia psychrerythraea 34H]
MSNNSVKQLIKPFSLLGVIGLSIWLISLLLNSTANNKTQSYIISSADYLLLKEKVQALNLVPSHELAIINAVAVDLNQSQLSHLQQSLTITVTKNHSVELSGGKAWGKRKWQPKSVVNDLIDASPAHAARNFGDGVTIGFLDTGLDQLEGTSNGLGLSTDLYGRDKFWGTYDAINNNLSNYSNEESGHGTHVASIAGNADYDVYGKVYGVAPNASLVGIKAFDAEGKATYADVIRGIEWALQVKDQINLRVLNMSFSGPARSYYWEDPLNQAVMKAWQAGIVVVASAGNSGPDPMTIGVPGNVPYIITVGAMTDNFTESDPNDDKLATFSAAGPTFEGFVKPEIVAPGGHLSGLMAYDSQIVQEHPEFHDGGRYFEMSGTSQAAGVVSGVVALMLTQDPALTPDQVKCRLMDSAHAAFNNNGELAYSVFQQGSGLVNVADALTSTASACANQALDIAQDLEGNEHFFGPSNINEDGNFYVEGLGDEYVWKLDDSNLGGDTIIWRMNFAEDALDWKNTASTDTIIWRMNVETNTIIWRMNVESDTIIWRMGIADSTTNINVNNWVEQQ